jgi:alanine dehydrogenase
LCNARSQKRYIVSISLVKVNNLMDIGVPKEIKNLEARVGLSPSSARVLSERGHQVYVETGAGEGSGFSDEQYAQVGATVVATADLAWDRSLVVKVKEPLASEFQYLQPDRLLFTYLHLAACPELTQAALAGGVTAIAYECVESTNGRFPLLAPMSAIAGRLSVQMGARYLEKQQGGSGVLLGGVPGVQPGRVSILGGGVVGTEAARMAVGMGAQVTIIDLNVERLNELEGIFGSRVTYLYSTSQSIESSVLAADLVIGAVLVPGKRAPILVPRSLVAGMRAGSVLVDVAVDQGGCMETMRTTSHSQPIYVEEGVVHYGVPNMPGAVPRTATQALNNSTLPYVIQLADRGINAIDLNLALAKGVNIRDRQIVHPSVKEVFGGF